MKKTFLTIVLLAMALSAVAQEKPQQNGWKREGKTFVQTDTQLMKGYTITAYTWRDSQGQEYR